MAEPSLRHVLVTLALAGLFVALLVAACVHDTAYYREHGVWWGTPPPPTGLP